MELKNLGLKIPPYKISKKDLLLNTYDYKIHKIKNVNLVSGFLLSKKGYGSLYAKKTYTNYRKLYKKIFNDILLGRDIDHLYPKSKAKDDEYILIGHISSKINRSVNDKTNLLDIILKGMNRNDDGKYLTKNPRASELGRYVQNGYLRPLSELNSQHLIEAHREDILKTFNI